LTYFYKHTLVVCRCSLVAKTLIVIQAQSSWSPSKNVFLISLRGIYVQLCLQLSFILFYCLYAPTTSQLNILTSKFLNIGKKYFYFSCIFFLSLLCLLILRNLKLPSDIQNAPFTGHFITIIKNPEKVSRNLGTTGPFWVFCVQNKIKSYHLKMLRELL
jgi:hypothetical protein